MSAFKDPPRLIDSPDVSSVVRDALAAGGAAGGPDLERLLHIEQRLPRAASSSTAAPGAGASIRVAQWMGHHGRWLLLGVASVGGVATFEAQRPSGLTTRAPSAVESGIRPRALTFAGSTPNRAPRAPDAFRQGETAAPTLAPASVPTLAPASAPAPTEGDEIALLARAHDSLHERPAESLALCQKHETDFVRGRFAEEREAVAIEALVYLHRADEAERRWARFQNAYPTSSHRVHLAHRFTRTLRP
jgi:hypothetical protein